MFIKTVFLWTMYQLGKKSYSVNHSIDDKNSSKTTHNINAVSQHTLHLKNVKYKFGNITNCNKM